MQFGDSEMRQKYQFVLHLTREQTSMFCTEHFDNSQFIQDELVGYCQNAQYICDEIGFGAQLIIDK